MPEYLMFNKSSTCHRGADTRVCGVETRLDAPSVNSIEAS
jgi:hypothetical protein